MSLLSVTKIDAATWQLAAAIRLYFEDGEPLAVHTIAGAAHGLLRDLLGPNARPSRHRVGTTGVQPDQTAFVTKMVRDARNFLKHADRDPQGVLAFNTDWTDFLMYEAIHMHMKLTCELTPESSFFLMWVTAKYPTVLLLEDLTKGRIHELRRIFPALGTVAVQKRTFLSALINASQAPGGGT